MIEREHLEINSASPEEFPTNGTLPTQPDDPRLDGWYHTIDLGNGLVSRGLFDHRPVVSQYGLPKSLRGKTVLDVGTADGFWAFEMERRGADRVVAIDVATHSGFDWMPRATGKMGQAPDIETGRFFKIAHSLLSSNVEYQVCNVYDLSPQKVGVFDIVFCGSLLVHLQNPLKALANIHSVTKEMAIVETLMEGELNEQHPTKPWVRFGYRELETLPGENCIYWISSFRAITDMLVYAGFAKVQRQASFEMPLRSKGKGDLRFGIVFAYPEALAPSS